ncbi:lysis protein [Xenorhabdus bovienii]|uniref:Lysis protein n=2 Tax=Xenorhabdus bovienii TaxID=40576 RepID=A0AAJ1N365_XENBV|nr:lysis protein [Xenorhabdus bovienii]MCG3462189.1 lysis protein [Xenorhabdus bovienii]MDE1476260.1 lysis protein [Xenorhabdus bovienii]MDE1478331.1 lysis protein [Xenorhabdus bovienii]MDE1486460.1 lysis protein [Xenorhabdus bovienii]MDE1497218.1 lysis protein [Xenorhabdus bovienii]
MMLSPSVITTASLAVAVIDRIFFQRKQVILLNIGDSIDRGRAIAFPVMFKNKANHLKGALIEYWLRDTNNPTTVINGKTRTLDISKKGVNEEYLLIDKKYLTPGAWELHVRVTHGNCRWNPLYRLFPVQSQRQKSCSIQWGDK